MKIYGSKNCHKCKELVDLVTKEEMEFEYIDVDTLSMEEKTQLINEHGIKLPIVIF